MEHGFQTLKIRDWGTRYTESVFHPGPKQFVFR